MTDTASITKTPPTNIRRSSCLQQMAMMAMNPPMASEPVSPMNTWAGWALNQRKPRPAPAIAAQSTVSSPLPGKERDGEVFGDPIVAGGKGEHRVGTHHGHGDSRRPIHPGRPSGSRRWNIPRSPDHRRSAPEFQKHRSRCARRGVFSETARKHPWRTWRSLGRAENTITTMAASKNCAASLTRPLTPLEFFLVTLR